MLCGLTSFLDVEQSVERCGCIRLSKCTKRLTNESGCFGTSDIASGTQMRAVNRRIIEQLIGAATIDGVRRSLSEGDLHHRALAQVVVDVLSKVCIANGFAGSFDDADIAGSGSHAGEHLQRFQEGMFGHAVSSAIALLEKSRNAIANIRDNRACGGCTERHIVDDANFIGIGIFDLHRDAGAEEAHVANHADEHLMQIELSSAGRQALKAHDQQAEESADADERLEVPRAADHGQRIEDLSQECGIPNRINREHGSSLLRRRLRLTCGQCGIVHDRVQVMVVPSHTRHIGMILAISFVFLSENHDVLVDHVRHFLCLRLIRGRHSGSNRIHHVFGHVIGHGGGNCI